jgi:hypothetical protein
MKLKNFCRACGNKLQFPDAEVCPNCKANFEKDFLYYFDYCPICGKKLSWKKGILVEICPECGVRINKKFEFYLSEFIIENASLLTISSIFIALAVYLTQIAASVNKTDYTYFYGSLQFNILDLSVGASIFLSLLISSVIFKKIIVEYFTVKLAKSWYSLSGLKLTLIFTLFIFLFGGVFLYFYTTYKIVFSIFLLIVMISISPIIEIGLTKFFRRIIQTTEMMRSHEEPFYIFFLCGSTILLYLLYKLSSVNGPIILLSGVIFIVGFITFFDFFGNLWLFLMKFIWNRIKPKIF